MTKKKLMMVGAVVAAALSAWAATETVGGYTWTYQIDGDTAVIYGTYNGSPSYDYTPAISPKSTGAVTIPSTLGGKPVTSIGDLAFSGCRGLTSVTIPNSVTSIGSSAFSGCSGLTGVTIPDSVTSIGDYAFHGCSDSLFDTTTIPGVKLVDGWAVGYTGLLSGDLDLTGIRGIGSSAFSGCRGLTSVTIPDSVTSIVSSAFYCCSGLTSVTIPDSVTSIGDSAFYMCSGLTSVTIPDSVTSIGGGAFESCSGLTGVTIPDGVTSIGYRAFSGCSGLTSVHITDLAKWCGISFGSYDANPLCYSHNLYLNGELLTELTIPDSVTSIGWSAFYGCSGLTSVTIPDGVTSIGDYAFYGCSGLTSVTIGNGVTGIGYSAFYGCSGLTSVTIGNGVTGIGYSAFYNCTNVTDVVVPGWDCHIPFGAVTNLVISEGATSIMDLAFSGCSGLTAVTIPDSVTSIGEEAFRGCSGLTSVTIGNGVTGIGYYAFYNCSGLTSVTIPQYVLDRQIRSVFSSYSSITNVAYSSVITNIGSSAFYGCSGLTSVTIPDSVTSIGEEAFRGCSGLTSVTIPDSVTSIGWSAFYGCRGLTSVTIPDGVTSIGGSAFSGCSGLTSVTIPDSVTSIESWAFYNCSGLTSVTIPDSVTSIGYEAFYGCRGLTSVTIPDSVTSIGSEAFRGCSGLTSVTIPDSVTSIGSEAFSGCSGLTSVTIPDSVTSIGSSAFSGCSGLTSVTIPDSVTSIGGLAFYGCSGLTSVTIPNSVTSIGGSAFSGCSGLTSVTIPDSVTSIGYEAFSGCSGLTSVFFGGNAPSVANWAFRDCACTVYVPYGSTGWDVPIPGTWKGLKIRYLTYVTVTFDANGGTGGWSRKLVRGTAIVAPTVTREGYTFRGWSPSVPVTVPADDVTYTAQWENQYTVTFNANGGTGGWSRKLDRGSAIVAPTVTREWFNFTGWSPAVAATVPANNVTYTAQWARWGDTISASKMGGKTMRELYPSDYTRMTTVVLEEGISEVPIGFFDGCGEVTDVTWPSTLVEFGKDAIPPKILAKLSYNANGFMIYNGWVLDYQDRSASAVTIPEGIVGIGRGAFAEMYDLETVTMPESLRAIATGAFEDCSWIQNIQFVSGLRYVGRKAFRGCSSLLGASFADGVEHVGVSAFEDCWQMKSVRLPYTVTYIGDNAFKGCSAIRGVTVPTHLKTMQNLFPASYSQIETAEVAEGETSVMDDMFKGCVALRGGATQTDMSMIPNTVTNIGARAFQNCSSLTAFVVPDSVNRIGVSVFQGCSSLWNVTLSRSLTEIPDYAFYGCSMLETMVVPESVTYLGNSFFCGKYRGDNALYYLCTNAPDYHSGAYAAIAGNMTTYVLQDSRSWDGRQGSRVLPQSWNGYDITYWTPNRFDVTFDANGGQFDSMGGSTWSEQQITDTTYALPSTEPVRPGWAFEGWWTEQTGGAEVRYTTVVTATRTHTIYAHWRSLGNKMTVKFNSNGGTVVTPGSQDYVPGQTFGQFLAPTRRGYTFQGWWTEAVNGIRMTEATQVPAADMELFAHWKPITYYVRFHANGGTGTMSDQLFTFDVSGALKTHTFTRTGFAFTGWATTPSGQVRYAENKTVVNLEEVQDKVVNLYAVWSGIGYSVRFDSNGGTGIMDNQTIAVGETQNLWPCAFTRGGYTFAGWAVSPTDAAAKKVMYLNGAAVKDLATSNGATVSLYAVWVTGAQTVRITFDANGGSVSPSYWDCPVETAVEAFPTPTRPGFTFAGWWTANTGGTRVESIAPVTAAQTLYAHWTENGGVVPGDNSCTVTFDVNGNGALRGEEVTRKVVKNTAIGELPIPMVPSLAGSGFGDFLGWFTGKTGGAQISSGTIVTKDITYYAHWKYFRYIVLDANGGKFSEKYDDWWPFVEDGATIGSLPAASRSGYSFDGWYTAVSGGSKVSANTKITATASNIREPLKYYAHWSANGGSDTPPPITTCTVTFNANGGTGGKTVTLNYGAKLTAPTVTRAGYTFVGWSPAVPATVPANNATYTAQWKKNEEPEEEHELYETVDGEAPLAAASEYNGYLYDESGAMKGTIQVKVGKPNAKTGLATIKATVVVGTKKVTLKAEGKGSVQIAADGPTAIGFVGGEPCTVVLGSDGISGFYGGHDIDGARNFFTSKDKGEQNAANAVLGKWLGGVSILADAGNFTVTISAKGKAKVSGTLANGKKATGSAVFLVGEEWACVPVVLPKANISFALWLPLDGGEVVVNGLGDDVVAGRGGALKAGSEFCIDADEFAAVTGIAALPYLPDGVSVEPNGAKWVVAGGAKAGKVAYRRGTQEIDEAKLGDNPSGLKLTYKKTDGSFKGSFKVYAEVKGKLKATTVSVSGIVLNGIGYGTATVKGKGGVAVTIE